MNIDYISDIHEEETLSDKTNESPEELKFMNKLFMNKNSNILIISGDLSDKLHRVVYFLKKIKSLFNYDFILYIPGNHDLYTERDNLMKTRDKYYKLMESVNSLNDLGIHFFNGDILEIEGIKFGGTAMWYDGYYYRKVVNESMDNKKFYFELENYAYEYMPDAMSITQTIRKMFLWQLSKLRKVVKEADVVFTHICPIAEDKFLSPAFKGQVSNGFFSFNGAHFIKNNNNIKVWVYGHIHSEINDSFEGTQMLCNPVGKLSSNISVKSFEV